MNAEYVELVLLEQSLAIAGGMGRPFFDRVNDVAEKTAGSIVFDVRVDGDTRYRRAAAIGYGANGTVAIVMDKYGQLSSAPLHGNDDLIFELSEWCSLPMAEQARVSYRGAVARLLAKLRRAGFLE